MTEDLPLEPLTDYSRFKAMCEEVLLGAQEPGFAGVILRPATVCGYSPRLRLDLTVNILTNHAINTGQASPSSAASRSGRTSTSTTWRDAVPPAARRAGSTRSTASIFNAGYENHTVREIAEMVREVVGTTTAIVATPSDDHRSYHISSEKIRRELGFIPRRSIADAARGLLAAFHAGRIPDPMTR